MHFCICVRCANETPTHVRGGRSASLPHLPDCQPQNTRHVPNQTREPHHDLQIRIGCHNETTF